MNLLKDLKKKKKESSTGSKSVDEPEGDEIEYEPQVADGGWQPAFGEGRCGRYPY